MIIIFAIAACLFCACQQPQKVADITGGKLLLTVDFEQGQTLRYKFVSKRSISVDFSAADDRSSKKPASQKYGESFEMTVAYTPVEVTPYGASKIEAVVESVSARQSSSSRSSKADAVQALAGKTWTMTVDSTGKIIDTSGLEILIKEVGEKSFRSRGSDDARIKDPDLIKDFIATQWFMWDEVSKIPDPVKGIQTGQTWDSVTIIPSSIIFPFAKNVSYTLADVNDTPQGDIAVIKEDYSLAETVPTGWPNPYPGGSFQMAGTFGMLRGYKPQTLVGTGQYLFDIDKGRPESYSQNYVFELTAGFPMNLGGRLGIVIEQNLTMELLK
ncbi:MAG: DUF6263 family protein [Phycisphaerae bacterium]|nr:DUF6263 family protein [Phycisphaerae bacterium]